MRSGNRKTVFRASLHTAGKEVSFAMICSRENQTGKRRKTPSEYSSAAIRGRRSCSSAPRRGGRQGGRRDYRSGGAACDFCATGKREKEGDILDQVLRAGPTQIRTGGKGEEHHCICLFIQCWKKRGKILVSTVVWRWGGRLRDQFAHALDRRKRGGMIPPFLEISLDRKKMSGEKEGDTPACKLFVAERKEGSSLSILFRQSIDEGTRKKTALSLLCRRLREESPPRAGLGAAENRQVNTVLRGKKREIHSRREDVFCPSPNPPPPHLKRKRGCLVFSCSSVSSCTARVKRTDRGLVLLCSLGRREKGSLKGGRRKKNRCDEYSVCCPDGCRKEENARWPFSVWIGGGGGYQTLDRKGGKKKEGGHTKVLRVISTLSPVQN